LGLTSTKPLDDPFAVFGVAPPVGVSPSTPSVVSTTTKELDDPFAVFSPQTKPVTGTKESVLASSEDMSSIRKMMVASKDTYYQTATDDETYDAFMSHMRWLDSNEVYTAKEAVDVYAADDETKIAYGEAYKVYDKVGSIFTNGGDLGDKAGAIKDYGLAILTSPSTYAGFVLGKLAGRASSKALTEVSKDLILNAATTAAKEVAKKGGTQAAQATIKREVVNAAVKVSTKRAVVAAAAVEGLVANFQDTLYQDVMMDTGAQEEFSYMQSAISTVLGGSGAITSLLAHKTLKGSSGLADAGKKIEEGKAVRAGKAVKGVTGDIKKAIKRVSSDWSKLVEEGRGLDDNPALRDAVVGWFTDYKNDGGFISILQKHGVAIEATDDKTFSNALTDFALSLNQASRDELTKVFEPLGITFPQVVQKFSAIVNEAGYQNQSVSSASKFLNNYKGITVSNRSAAANVARELTDDAVKEPVSGDKQVLAYIMSVWKRMLVSHPATTIANVQGFGIAMGARTAAEVVQMSALYGAAGVKTLMGSSTAGKTLGEANALLKNISYMTRMAVDPFTTVEAFHALLEQASKKHQKRVAKQFFQGVDNAGAEAFGFNPKGTAVKTTEGLVSLAQRLSFVNAQDVITKSFSGMKELDKQTRLKFGKGIDEMVNTGRSHEITDDMWERSIKALEEDTFSKDFRGAKGLLGQFADISQWVSAKPGVGFFYPFGQFVNSVIDFGIRYSPLALAPIAGKVMKKQIDVDLGEKVSQMIVGTTMIGTLAHREAGKEKDGLQWNEERDDAGGVYKVDNLFPWGLYNLAGRISLGISRGEGMNKDLMTAVAQQLSVPAALSDLGNPQIVRDMVAYATDPATSEEDSNIFWDLMGYAANSIAPIAAGFTRPLDPVNKFVGAYSDAYGITSNATIDRKLSPGIDGTIQSFGRYTNTLFDVLLGEPDKNGKLLYGAPKHSATQAGEIRSGNVGAGIFGAQYAQRRTPIDKLLGMVNKAPFKADSFTSGNPEYDDWMNQNVNPILEREASRLMNNEVFMALPMAGKMREVDLMLTAARNEVLAHLDTSGGKEDQLINERRKLLILPKNDRNAAKEELGITTPDHKLNSTQIRLIKNKMKMNEKMYKEKIRN
jgi:hypothetical protein